MVLRRLGLKLYERQLVMSLVKQDRATVNYRDAMNMAGIPYGKVHAVLNGLEEKGFLEGDGGRPRQYKLRPIGDVIEEYIVRPLISDFYGHQNVNESTFRDIWVREICSSIPVVRVDREMFDEPITMLSGIDDIRKAQIAEITRAKEEVLMCFPRGTFLDRKFSDYVSIGMNVRLEVISSLTPAELMRHTFPSQVREVRKMLGGRLSRPRVHYFLNSNVRERFMVIDGSFATIGSDMSPVLMHLYSKEHCSVLKERFLELKKQSKEINPWRTPVAETG